MKLRGLYAIVDLGTLSKAGLEPIAFAKEILSVRPAALQLRAKNFDSEIIFNLANELVPLCMDAKVPFVLNDHVDLAYATHADLAHFGQDDHRAVDVGVMEHLAPQLKYGRSTHTADQLVRALEEHPAYVAYGPIFATASKENPDPVVGLEGLAKARAIISKSASPETPLVAIGGITLENAAKIAEFADAGAVIGALVTGDVRARAAAFHEKLGGAR